MSKMIRNKPMSIREAVIETLKNQPDGQASLSEIYEGVNCILGKKIADTSVRSVIYHAMKHEKKISKYTAYFSRVTKRTYRLIKPEKSIKV